MPTNIVIAIEPPSSHDRLSAGITGTLNAAGQLVLIVAMFVGRVGPLTIALALTARFSARERIRYPEAEINIG